MDPLLWDHLTFHHRTNLHTQARPCPPHMDHTVPVCPRTDHMVLVCPRTDHTVPVCLRTDLVCLLHTITEATHRNTAATDGLQSQNVALSNLRIRHCRLPNTQVT